MTYGDSIPYMGTSSYHMLLDDTLYLFGGAGKNYRNDLHKLNLFNYRWENIFPNGSIPSPTCEGGSICYGTSMLVYGGKGNPLPHSESPKGATFKANLNFGYLCDDGWHNALYEFNTIESKIGPGYDIMFFMFVYNVNY